MIGCQEELDEIFDRFRYEQNTAATKDALKHAITEYLTQLKHEDLLVMEVPVVGITGDGGDIQVSFTEPDNPYRELCLEDIVRVAKLEQDSPYLY